MHKSLSRKHEKSPKRHKTSARAALKASQKDELELELNDNCNPTILPACTENDEGAENDDGAGNDEGGKDPCLLPCFALAANAEGGMINSDAPALAQAAEVLNQRLTHLDCILEGGKSSSSCLSAGVDKGKDDVFLHLKCC